MPKGTLAKSDDVFILNADERLFKSWATVEIVDKQGQIIPIDQFKKMMPKLMKRGAPLTIYHVGVEGKPQAVKIVGKLLNYEFQLNPKYDAEGMLVTGQVFSDFKMDDEAWQGIQNGSLSGLSVAGEMAVLPNGESVWIEPCAFGLGKPANPAATMVAMSMAKTDGEFEKESKEHPSLPEKAIETIVNDHAEVKCSKCGGEPMAKEQAPPAPAEAPAEAPKVPAEAAKEAPKDAPKEGAPEAPVDEKTAAPAQPPQPPQAAPPAPPAAAPSNGADEMAKVFSLMLEGMAKQSDLLNKIMAKLGGAEDVKASAPAPQDVKAPEPAPEQPKQEEKKEAPAAKAEEPAKEETKEPPKEEKKEAAKVDAAKAAIQDLSKTDTPAPATVTPKPAIKEVAFNPDMQKRGNNRVSAVDIAKGDKQLDTFGFVRSGELWGYETGGKK